MVKEKNEPFTIRVKPSLMEQVENYIELSNSIKDRKENKFTKVDFFNNLLSDYFEHRVLTNDFITLKEPLYFNSHELVNNGSVKCSTVKPTDLDNIFIVKRVPNNLDTLKECSSDSFTYYYEKPYNHKGIVFSGIPLAENLEAKYLVFDYNEVPTKELELNISILKLEDLTAYLDIEKNKQLILYLKEEYDTFKKEFKDIQDFFSEKDVVNNSNLEELPEEVIKKLAELGYNMIKYYCYNFNSFIPIKFYSKLNQILILFNNSSSEEVIELEEELGISKKDLEVYLDSFKNAYDLSSKTPLLWKMVFDSFGIDNKLIYGYSLDFDNLVNNYLNNEETSVLIKSLFD